MLKVHVILFCFLIALNIQFDLKRSLFFFHSCLNVIWYLFSPRSSHDVSPSRAGSLSQTAGGDGKDGAAGLSQTGERPATPPPRHLAFEDFKKDEGAQLNKILNDNKGS